MCLSNALYLFPGVFFCPKLSMNFYIQYIWLIPAWTNALNSPPCMVMDKCLVKNKQACKWATCVIQEFVKGCFRHYLKRRPSYSKSCPLSVLGLSLFLGSNASSFHQELRQQPVAINLGHRSTAGSQDFRETSGSWRVELKWEATRNQESPGHPEGKGTSSLWKHRFARLYHPDARGPGGGEWSRRDRKTFCKATGWVHHPGPDAEQDSPLATPPSETQTPYRPAKAPGLSLPPPQSSEPLGQPQRRRRHHLPCWQVPGWWRQLPARPAQVMTYNVCAARSARPAALGWLGESAKRPQLDEHRLGAAWVPELAGTQGPAREGSRGRGVGAAHLLSSHSWGWHRSPGWRKGGLRNLAVAYASI